MSSLVEGIKCAVPSSEKTGSGFGHWVRLEHRAKKEGGVRDDTGLFGATQRGSYFPR